MKVEMTPSCGECGSNDLIGPDDMTDESVITCNACGAENGTLGELKAAAFRLAEQEAEKHGESAFGEAFEGLDGIKFTKSVN